MLCEACVRASVSPFSLLLSIVEVVRDQPYLATGDCWRGVQYQGTVTGYIPVAFLGGSTTRCAIMYEARVRTRTEYFPLLPHIFTMPPGEYLPIILGSSSKPPERALASWKQEQTCAITILG